MELDLDETFFNHRFFFTCCFDNFFGRNYAKLNEPIKQQNTKAQKKSYNTVFYFCDFPFELGFI